METVTGEGSGWKRSSLFKETFPPDILSERFCSSITSHYISLSEKTDELTQPEQVINHEKPKNESFTASGKTTPAVIGKSSLLKSQR